ncbi:myelin basic protein-like isoform X2 [Myxocyprinus asiaticus]|uniref:myelin basic protein-like isoform X2 n=1 Tax=Myxocyprinus asiaticus TaxID=70543 RepID=UPI002222210E|nr:myelin basic protein-like isoform X2 [Myxocyprinus asiaticus]
MATASTSGQSAFGLGRKKRAPGLLDKIGRFFGGDKKRKGKGSFRGHLSSSPQRPQHSSTRRRGDVNPVVHFFRSFVSSPRPKSKASSSPRGTESIRSPHRRRREQNTLSRIFNVGESRSRSPPKRWSTIF